MMVAAEFDRTELGLTLLPDLVRELEQPFARYIWQVPQVAPERQPWDKDKQRPDLIVRLPAQRELRVDDKVGRMADIPQVSIDWRLDELLEKPYHTQFSDRTDWTVLYIPSETFFAGAVSTDNDLIERALRQNVLIATPSIFQALLAEVDKAWTAYREEFPDLGEEEWDYLPQEHRPDLEPDYEPPSGLPRRIPYAERKTRNGDS